MPVQYSLKVQYSEVTLSDITVLCRMENGVPYKGGKNSSLSSFINSDRASP